MSRLTMVLFSIASVTLMGIGVVVALVLGHYRLEPIVIAAAIGLVAALPVSWLLARRLQ
ncbi:CTP synthetase [Ruixingdingia sedimenti]|uniref:CTP synthetase n=1 Tax=Ruixingdingia sedimenti TaxID=3073604 RepID=A0ABU1F8G5_9RHOB|nr:CTP synthetase [Xinfangfangia sp. LG-4]MDR5653114.1 CTP synthetase [Xinfangfangia sp. LG-4]